MNIPIIFIVFNRPDTAAVVFEEIRRIKPKKLYVIADGPRKNHPTDEKNCAETRKIIDNVDWDCEVIKDFSENNLGCRERVSSGITNAFSRFDRAIILEDDCVPNQSFFQFCEEMLERYKDNEKIMSVTGNNFLFEKSSMIKDSYYFSRFPYIWGWATWKRAWDKYDGKMSGWPEMRNKRIMNRGWKKRFDDTYQGKINTWDIQWTFSCLTRGGLTVVPKSNLVSNIGFGNQATHTQFKTITADMPTEEITFPLQHPDTIEANREADKISNFHFTRTGIIIDIIKNFLKK